VLHELRLPAAVWHWHQSRLGDGSRLERFLHVEAADGTVAGRETRFHGSTSKGGIALLRIIKVYEGSRVGQKYRSNCLM
jgi:hypothetical protein